MEMLRKNFTIKVILLMTMCIMAACFPSDRDLISSESSVQADNPAASIEPSDQQLKLSRARREIIFRPLFVYKQEELEKHHFNNKFVLAPQAEQQYQQYLSSNFYG
ncbi:uncharacterized protein LOC131687032 [Topomyia yanbarensis]|uniref:uncharacterized protein LOC131687032 n=1 Tax=Topomyia yanbarensis TaxID=2498891 RepID=UPI00273BF9A8|nr:uncharacterized protein LOC131687032 [Topomyia yanbarensis]